MEKTNIGLFGFGVVGQGLYHILQQYPDLGIHIKQIGVKHPEKERTLPAEYFTYERDDIIADPDIELIAELTDDEQGGFEIVKAALEAGKKVVSANKKMIAQNLKALLKLQEQHNGTLLYEAAVCGSIPVIRTMEDYFGNENLTSVNGIFNGSSNYILSKIFNEHLDYGTALEEAQNKGYAESDPTLDVGGYDAKYKLAIAAAHAFGITVQPADILTLGIENLSSFDKNQVRQKEQKLKLVSKAIKTADHKVSLLVTPQFVSKCDRLYEVDEEYNAVIMEAPFSGQQFLVGQGAGANPTGSAVLSDILAALKGYAYPFTKAEKAAGVTFDSEQTIEVYVGYAKAVSLEEWPFQAIHFRMEGLGRNAVIGTIKVKDLLAFQDRIREEQVFIAATGREEEATISDSSVLAQGETAE